jgi:hypothetical protein
MITVTAIMMASPGITGLREIPVLGTEHAATADGSEVGPSGNLPNAAWGPRGGDYS